MAEISVGESPRRLILVGSGLRAYREYSLATLAQVYELALGRPEIAYLATELRRDLEGPGHR